MRIDRAGFLAFASGIAAATACNTGPGPVSSANMVDIPAQPPQPVIDAAAPEPEKPKMRTELRAVAVEPDDLPDDDGDLTMPTAEGGVVALAPAGQPGAGCGFADPKSLPKPASTCDDSVGLTGVCTRMKCKADPFPRQKCAGYLNVMKPGTARRAVDCLATLSDKLSCDACAAYKCGDRAMKMSCPDPAVDAECGRMTRSCKSLTMADCKTYMSGLNSTGRTQLAKCVTSKAGCGWGIFSCAEGLF